MEGNAGCYTLLADDNSRFSNEKACRDEFKAHLIYNVILNGRIVFSDNQVLCSSNLQWLVSHDPVTLALLEEGFFDLAIRAEFEDEPGIAPLHRVHRAFVQERKILHAAKRYEESPALTLIDRHAARIPWHYASIRTNYSDNCRKLLLREFEPLLTPTQHEWLRARLEEGESDHGLGRKYLQDELVGDMKKKGISVDSSTDDLVRRCTEAPYLSNLPSLIQLNPVYAPEHRPSFDLMRGPPQELVAVGAERTPCRFDHEHYVKGLCALGLDDVRALQELASRNDYIRLSGRMKTDSDYDGAWRAFREFNLLVEDRIASRFPEIARRTSGDPDRTFVRQKAREYGKAAADDVAGILINWAVPGAPAALCKQVIFDIGAWLRGPETRKSVDAETLDRDLALRRLGDHFGKGGGATKIRLEESKLLPEDEAGEVGFSKEIMVS